MVLREHSETRRIAAEVPAAVDGTMRQAIIQLAIGADGAVRGIMCYGKAMWEAMQFSAITA